MENKREYGQNTINDFNRKDYLVDAFIRVGKGLLDGNNPFFDFNNFMETVSLNFDKDPKRFFMSDGPEHLRRFYNNGGIDEQLREFDSNFDRFVNMGFSSEEIVEFRNRYVNFHKKMLSNVLEKIEKNPENKTVSEPFQTNFNIFRNKLVELEKIEIVKRKKPNIFNRFFNGVKNFFTKIFSGSKQEQSNNYKNDLSNNFNRITKNKKLLIAEMDKDENKDIIKSNEEGRKKLREELSPAKGYKSFDDNVYINATKELDKFFNRNKQEQKNV